MRTIVAGCVLIVFSFGVAVADDFFFSATKVENKDGKWVVTGKKKSKDAKEMTYTIDGTVKVMKGMVKKGEKKGEFTVEVGEAVDGGFKSDAFKDVSSDKPASLYLTTDGDKVTKVLLLQKKGKKKDA